jgi:hypothetical protein
MDESLLWEAPYLDDAFGHWLAGFMAGEGHFFIRDANRCGYTCGLCIKVRDDDLAVIEEIRDRLGIGRIYRGAPEKGNPYVEWHVATRRGCALMLAFFDRYDLRAKKGGDFFIWRAAVQEWLRCKPRQTFDWTRMAYFKAQIENQRAYPSREATLSFPVADYQLAFD